MTDAQHGCLKDLIHIIQDRSTRMGAAQVTVNPSTVATVERLSGEIVEARDRLLDMFEQATCDHKFASWWSGNNRIAKCARCDLVVTDHMV